MRRCLALRPLTLTVAAALALAACSGPRTHPSTTRPVIQLPRTVAASPAHAPKPAAVAAPARRVEPEKSSPPPLPAYSSRDALSPAEVGYYMDVLQGRLKQVPGGKLGIARRRNVIALVLPDAFDADSARLNANAHAVFVQLARVLVEYRKTTVTVRVSGDDSKTAPGTAALASLRGTAVADELRLDGVGSHRLIAAMAPASVAVKGKAAPAKRARLELLLAPIVLGNTAAH